MSRVIEYKNPSGWTQNASFTESAAAGTYYINFVGSGTGSRIVTETPVQTYGDSFTISIASGFAFAALWFDANKAYIGRTNGYVEWASTSPRSITRPIGAMYMIMYLRRNSGSLSVADIAEANLVITYEITNPIKILASDGISISDTKTLEETVSQHSTSISNNATNIALKANASDVYTKTDVDGLITSESQARASAIEQSAEQISLSVSQTYTTKTEFSNLELGGRNYALNSEFICDRSLYGGNEYFAYDLGRALPFGEGTPIVISFDLYMEVVTSRSELFVVYNTNNKGPHEVIMETRPFQGRTVSVGDVINERVVIVGTVRRDRTDANKDHDWIEFYTGYGSGNLYRISNFKLEKGTKATDWTPAPEEQRNDYLEVSGRNLIRNSTSVKMGGSDLNYQTAAANIPMYRWAYSTSNGVHTYTFTEDSNGVRTQNNAYTYLASYIIPGIVEMRNRDYSWALDVKIDGVENLGDNVYIAFDIDMRPSSTGGSHEVKFYANEMADGIWTHIGSSGIVGAADTSSLFEFGVYGLDTVTGSFAISYRNPILVYGNKVPADWSPAPEDEVVDRNAAIDLATDAIELSVRETYASKKQLGSRNLVETTAITSGYLATNGGIQPAGATFKEFTSDYIPVSSDKPMLFQYWVSVTGTGSGDGAGWMAYGFYDSNKSWLSSPGRFAKYSGLSNTPTAPVPWHGVYEINDIPSGAAYIRVSWRELTDGIVKLERRDDSDANISYQVEEAKAAIKVTTDGISTEVAKKVGVSEVISKINQSAESVKIQASKVEIDGTAIFNSISSNVNSSISNSISSAKLVKTTQDQWYSSTSATTKSGGSWATTQPSIVAGRYIWQRQYVTYSDNTTAYLPSEAGICTQGQTDLSGYSTTTQMNSAIGSAKQEAIAEIPTALSQLENDSNYATQTEAQGYATTVNTALENYKTATDNTLTSLQNQVDGQIEAWYKSVDPELSNEPANTWTTDTLKQRHIGDLYYNVITGHSWRWMQSGNTYEWHQIPDSDATNALAIAQNAQTLAGSKRRIFTSTPTVPYDIGDLWVNGSSIKYCSTMKTDSGTYSANDWTTTATDDTSVSALQQQLTAQLGTTEAPYREVEWVESDGREFIQLDWIPGTNWGFDVDFINYNTLTGSPSSGSAFNASPETNRATFGWIFGQRNANSIADPDIGLAMYIGGTGGLVCMGKTRKSAYMATDHTRQQCSLRNGTYTAPTGTTYNYSTSYNTKIPVWGMSIFAAGVSATRTQWAYPSSSRIYSLKFYDGSTLAVDLIPAVRNIDNMPGLYDKIANKFWACSGLSYGNSVRTFGNPKTLIEMSESNSPVLSDTRVGASRLWTADAPMLDSLEDGQKIVYRMKWPTATEAKTTELVGWNDSGSSNTVYLALKLSDGNYSDWIPCFSGASGGQHTSVNRLTTHFYAGSDISFTYHENVVSTTVGYARGWFADSAFYNNSTYNLGQNLWYNNIVAKTAWLAESMVVGGSSGYSKIDSGIVFDLDYPILWVTRAYDAGVSNYQDLYTSLQDRVLSTRHTITDGVKNSMVYLVGTVSGKQITLDSNYLRCTVPTSYDGLVYIPVGRLGNQSSGTNYFFFDCTGDRSLFMYLDGGFQQVTSSTTVATQKLYYRTTSLTAPTAPTTWITTNDTTVYNAWNRAIPPLAASKAENATRYPYIYSVEQHKRVDGTIVTSDISNDSNTTIIDGGSIITNSVTATQIAAGAITAEKLDATNINASNSLTIGALSTQTQSTILNSELSADIASAAKRTDVSIAVTAIDYAAGTATLQASLYIDGVVTTSGVTYQWLKDGTNISGQTSRTLSVTSAMGLSHVYSCTATY